MYQQPIKQNGRFAEKSFEILKWELSGEMKCYILPKKSSCSLSN